jgi:voltage-gated potassium channel
VRQKGAAKNVVAITSIARLSAARADRVAPQGLSPTNWALAILIVVAVASGIIETEPTISRGPRGLFPGFRGRCRKHLPGRIYRPPLDRRRKSAICGLSFPRLRYAVTPIAIIDLAAIVPVFFAFGGASSLLLRFFRVFRMLRLAKLGRTSRAWTAIREACMSADSSSGSSLASSR